MSRRTREQVGSTDMANLSLLMPAIHPMLGLSAGESVNHQPEFAAHFITAEAERLTPGVSDQSPVVSFAPLMGREPRNPAVPS